MNNPYKKGTVEYNLCEVTMVLDEIERLQKKVAERHCANIGGCYKCQYFIPQENKVDGGVADSICRLGIPWRK